MAVFAVLKTDLALLSLVVVFPHLVTPVGAMAVFAVLKTDLALLSLIMVFPHLVTPVITVGAMTVTALPTDVTMLWTTPLTAKEDCECAKSTQGICVLVATPPALEWAVM